MSIYTVKNIWFTTLITLGTILTLVPKSYANIPSLKTTQTIAQATQEQLDRQREAEKVLKQGENLRQDIRDRNNYDYNNRPDLERQTGEQINRVRESGSDPQKVKDAQAELNRLRDENNRRPSYYRGYYDPFYPGFYSTPVIIYSPRYSSEPVNPAPTQNQQPIGQDRGGSSPKATPHKTPILTAAAFKDGSILSASCG